MAKAPGQRHGLCHTLHSGQPLCAIQCMALGLRHGHGFAQHSLLQRPHRGQGRHHAIRRLRQLQAAVQRGQACHSACGG